MSSVVIIDDNDKRFSYVVDKTLPPIGKGGMGTVFRGVRIDNQNPDEKRLIAIKFLHTDLDPNVVARERRTADLKIIHDNVVEMMGFITMTIRKGDHVVTRYFVVSELLDGISLLNLIKGNTEDLNGKPFEFAQMMFQRFRLDRDRFVMDIALNVLRGLSEMHKCGYIHRDIDPSNIMLTVDGKIKIIDFGISKKIDSNGRTDPSLTHAGTGMGKAVYSSPEVLAGQLEAQKPSSDLYSVGIMIYAISVGHLPFSGTVTEIMIQKVNRKIPVEEIENNKIRKIVKKATYTDQSKRYKDALQFIEDLNREEGSSLSNWWWLGLIIGFIAVLAVLLIVLL